MSRVDLHLLLRPLALPVVPQYRTDAASLRNAGRLYAQLRAKGYSDETAARLASVGRLTGAVISYSEPVDGAA